MLLSTRSIIVQWCNVTGAMQAFLLELLPKIPFRS